MCSAHRPKPCEVRFDYCVAVSGPHASVAYVQGVFVKLDIPGLAPPGRRVIEQPALDRLGLTEDGQVDGQGRLVTEEWYRIEHDRCKKAGWGYVLARSTTNSRQSCVLSLTNFGSRVKPLTEADAMGQRDVCGKCGTTLEERLKWWNEPAPPGVVKIGNGRGEFLYCNHCQKGICGGCSIDLGMTAGCPFCRTELVYLDGTSQEVGYVRLTTACSGRRALYTKDMNDKKIKITDWDCYRARIEHEDNLLNNRTNLFLVVNGLGAVAVGLTTDKSSDIVMVVVILLANVFWIIGASQTTSVLKALTTEYINGANDPIDEVVRRSMGRWPRWMRNTSILGRYIPYVVTIGWGIGLYMLVISSSNL